MNNEPQQEVVKICVILFSVAFLFRLFHIGQESFFIDEVLTLKSCAGSTWEHIIHVEANPPLYFYLIRAWTILFGLSHFSLRLFSALAGAIAPIFVYISARALRINRSGAVFAGLMLAISPDAVWYGQQARSYSLLLTIIAAWLWIMISSIEHPSTRKYLLAAILLLIGFSTHYYFAFLALSAIGALSFFYLFKGHDPRFGKIVLSQLIAMSVCLIYIPLIYIQLSRGTLNWTPRPHFSDLAAIFMKIFIIGPYSEPTGIIRWVVGLFYGFLLLSLVWARWRPNRGESRFWTFFLITITTLPVLFPFLLSLGNRSIFLRDRYTIIALPGFILLIAFIIDRMPWRKNWGWSIAALFIIPLSLYANIQYWSTFQDFDWRGAISIIDEESSSDDSLIFFPSWMCATYQINGGKKTKIISGGNLENFEGKKPMRLWLFSWEQNPNKDQKKIVSDLIRRKGARTRIDFPHIKLWEIFLNH